MQILIILNLSNKYDAKLLENTEADGANRILRNTAIAAPSKYLSNFSISLEIPLINCKVELKNKWTKHCVLPSAGTEDADANSDNIIFTIKDIKLYIPVVTLSVKDNQKLSKLLIKGFERSMYWNEYKTKNDNKDTIDEYINFLESNFVGVNRLYVSVYSNVADNAQSFKPIINQKVFFVNGRNFYGQPNDSNKKRYEGIRKLAIGQGEDYTTGCLLDCEYLKI